MTALEHKPRRSEFFLAQREASTHDGTILLSENCDLETLARWNIDVGMTCGTFRKEQLPYLAYHREFILKAGKISKS